MSEPKSFKCKSDKLQMSFSVNIENHTFLSQQKCFVMTIHDLGFDRTLIFISTKKYILCVYLLHKLICKIKTTRTDRYTVSALRALHRDESDKESRHLAARGLARTGASSGRPQR